MAANQAPIYTLSPETTSNTSTGFAGTLLTATAEYTGVSATNLLVHTAGVNGSYIRRLRFKAIGSNVATVARIYINNGATNATATNNVFYGEVPLPSTTASNTTNTVDIDYSMEFALNASQRIYVGLGTTVAAGWICVAIAGQY